jgi:8-oxo-dGTP pyrophosphatase MutT (NUDIX family)
VRDDPFEVLMVRRRSSSIYSSALVFPGGMVETSDASAEWLPHVRGAEGLSEGERALRIAACRETYEEASIVVAEGAAAPPGAASYLDLVRGLGVKLDLASVLPFGHWITPESAPRRFDTYFFLCRAPVGAEAVSCGDETVSVEWVRPSEAIARADAGEHSILFPTLMNLRMLAYNTTVGEALETTRRRKIFTVMPRVSTRDDLMVINIPEEAGYGVSEYSVPAAMMAVHQRSK